MIQITQEIKTTRVLNAVAAGQTTQNSSGVDCKDFDTAAFIIALGAITATGVVTVKAQQSSDDGNTDPYADLIDASVAFADTDGNKLAILEIAKPQKRYVRVSIARTAANSALDGVLALQGDAKAVPVAQDANTVVETLLKLAPAQ